MKHIFPMYTCPTLTILFVCRCRRFSAIMFYLPLHTFFEIGVEIFGFLNFDASFIIDLSMILEGQIYPYSVNDFYLKTYAAIFHAHHSYIGKQESCLGSAIYEFGSIQVSDALISDGYFNIFLTK